MKSATYVSKYTRSSKEDGNKRPHQPPVRETFPRKNRTHPSPPRQNLILTRQRKFNDDLLTRRLIVSLPYRGP